MKPMKVEAGEHAPDLEELLKEAKKVEGKFGSKNANSFESVRGVDKVKPGQYSTNQQNIEVEDVKRTEPKKEEVNLESMQHSSHDDALSAHENSEGDKSDKNPQGAYNLTDYY
ncbi:MAG: hypothetical protein HOC79_03990 [Euryarchaeota archaeon]|jgi:hypothetical protein|nr:hypothetical protein [Euryarchaeota archaeon]